MDSCWFGEGLFSAHFLTERLPKTELYAAEDEWKPVYEALQVLFQKNRKGVEKGNEEDVEDRLVAPVLEALGFGVQKRRMVPGATSKLFPDFLLYASRDESEAAFQTGQHYTGCIGILEAKRWGVGLQQAATKKERSPHLQLRDYLNERPELNWGIATNGGEWRLYCRAAAASHFFGVDLAKALETEDTQAFRLFYTLFRCVVFAHKAQLLEAAIAGASQFREEIEAQLRRQVFDSMETLGCGFFHNAENKLSDSDLPAVFENTLILLYRILFVLNAEARALLPLEPSSPYFASYGIEAVRRKLAEPSTAAEYADDGSFALWGRLEGLFRLINGDDGNRNERLGIPRYNGGLFDPTRYPFLKNYKVADQFLAEALRTLTFRKESTGQVVAFDYASLGERHLGSIHEGLLEHKLYRDGTTDLVTLRNDKGERKAQGAYYTPQDWVAYLVSAALKPQLETLPQEGDDAFASAILNLNVCDPAMGSGHFLVEATSFLAEAAAAHPSTVTGDLAYWKRRVVEACIYGVDRNPLAVELAKLSLWLKTVDRLSLNFLDHHLRCGNSLIGTSLAALPRFPKPKQKVTASKKGEVLQLSLTFSGDLHGAVSEAIAKILTIEGQSTDTHAVAKEKEKLWKELAETVMPRFTALADLWVAPYFGGDMSWVGFLGLIDNAKGTRQARRALAEVLDPVNPFHWELEFPDVFFTEKGDPKPDPGFDAVIGNPPWERMKLAESEFFASRSTAIAKATRASDRKKLIAELPTTDPELWAAFQVAKADAEQSLAFVQKSGFYPLMGKGDTNLYAVFVEKATQIVAKEGRVALLVPSGIATDSTTSAFFRSIVEQKRLAELVDFENKAHVFPDVDSRFKFSIIVMSGESAPQEAARCGFFLHKIEEASDPTRTFPLTTADFATFNPNTLTCPIFRRQRDVELTRKLYKAAPILNLHSDEVYGNTWSIRFLRMFDMTLDSKKFKTSEELNKEGYFATDGNVFVRKKEERYLPLYEGKIFQMFDHRSANISVQEENLHRPGQQGDVTLTQHQDPHFSPETRFWVDESEVFPKIRFEKQTPFLLGFKNVCSPTNIRTMIMTAIPVRAAGHSIQFIEPDIEIGFVTWCCLMANLNSFVYDFIVRQKIGGVNLSYFIVEQIPTLPPQRYAEDFHGTPLADFIKPRVLELCYTAHDMTPFARALGYDGKPFAWDEEKRLHLKCQLDALYFLLYGLTREEATEVLETFPIVKKHDEAKFEGRYRTRELIDGYMKAYAVGNLDAKVR
nr:N-6 DNA methylase [Armatimonas sp.]